MYAAASLCPGRAGAKDARCFNQSITGTRAKIDGYKDGTGRH
uniref:Uncharacterized protein n=1 Tax=Brassica oleracea TaxID=3712 RepID=A0A3P6CEK5_BRAOL|nr:unnamed protein product [Brassica oleracea]